MSYGQASEALESFLPGFSVWGVSYVGCPAPAEPRGRRVHYTPGMIRLIETPTIVKAAGNKPKRIEEFVGRVNTGHAAVSVARMASPGGWVEPGQAPEFDEFTIVLRGTLRVESREATLDVRAGQAVHVPAGDWVRYSTPDADGAEYMAVCLPAFSPQNVHRDPS